MSRSLKIVSQKVLRLPGIGLMIATALENNGALVFIVGRRKHVLEKAAAEKSVCTYV